jgi:hypothetical protein
MHPQPLAVAASYTIRRRHFMTAAPRPAFGVEVRNDSLLNAVASKTKAALYLKQHAQDRFGISAEIQKPIQLD